MPPAVKAAQKAAAGQPTTEIEPAPGPGVDCQVAAAPAGLPDVSTLPWASPATHRVADGQDTELTLVPSTNGGCSSCCAVLHTNDGLVAARADPGMMTMRGRSRAAASAAAA